MAYAINVTTGVLVGAVGVTAQIGADGTRGQRPLAGFYLADSRLLWVAEDQRTEVLSTYSVFEELAKPALTACRSTRRRDLLSRGIVRSTARRRLLSRLAPKCVRC